MPVFIYDYEDLESGVGVILLLFMGLMLEILYMKCLPQLPLHNKHIITSNYY